MKQELQSFSEKTNDKISRLKETQQMVINDYNKSWQKDEI